MPKNKVEMRSINKEIFIKVLKIKESSIRKLGKESSIQITERTIRRSLNDGRMRDCNVRDIAQFLNVDPRVLTGEIFSTHGFFDFDPLEHLEAYPYSREEEDKYRSASIKETISRILSTFNRSYIQYEALNINEQYEFEIEVLGSMFSVIEKYFPRNLYGEENAVEDIDLIIDLSYERDMEKELQKADTDIRKKYMITPPEGYTSEQIKDLPREQIYGIFMDEIDKELFPQKVSLKEKYKNIPSI